MPASSMPWLRSTCASYFRWWPTLRDAAVLEPGLERMQDSVRDRAAPARRHSDAPAARKRPCPARCRSDRPTISRLHVVEAGGLGVEGNQFGGLAGAASQLSSAACGETWFRSVAVVQARCGGRVPRSSPMRPRVCAGDGVLHARTSLRPSCCSSARNSRRVEQLAQLRRIRLADARIRPID